MIELAVESPIQLVAVSPKHVRHRIH